MVAAGEKSNEVSVMASSFLFSLYLFGFLSALEIHEAGYEIVLTIILFRAMKLIQNTHFQFLLFAIILAGGIFILSWILPFLIHEEVWYIYFFLTILSFLVGLLSGFLLKSFPDNFFQIMVLGMVLRFIASITFIGIYAWMGLENIILFIANFFIIFLFYLTFDIYTFISNLRPISK